MRLTCHFCIEDLEFPCKNSIELPTETQDSCVWMDPFRMDGLKVTSELKIKFCIQTPSKCLVDMFSVYLELKHLSFSKHIYSVKNRRNSTHNVSKYISPRDVPSDSIHSIQIDNVEITYIADRFNDLIRLRITSILARITKEFVDRFTSRTRIRLTAELNGINVYKANRVFLMENGSKLFSWVFDPDGSQQAEQHKIIGYDCDLDHSDENNVVHLKPFQVKDRITIRLVRSVFFPTDTSGMLAKELTIELKAIDFKARLKNKKDSTYRLERGLRMGVLLSVWFDVSLTILRMDVLIDDFPQTIEQVFNLVEI